MTSQLLISIVLSTIILGSASYLVTRLTRRAKATPHKLDDEVNPAIKAIIILASLIISAALVTRALGLNIFALEAMGGIFSGLLIVAVGTQLKSVGAVLSLYVSRPFDIGSILTFPGVKGREGEWVLRDIKGISAILWQKVDDKVDGGYKDEVDEWSLSLARLSELNPLVRKPVKSGVESV